MARRASFRGLCIALLLLCIPATAGAETMQELTSKGRANIGFNTSFSFTSAKNEQTDGETAQNSTLFFLATPKFGYFLADRLELTIQIGTLMRRLQRGEDSKSTETSGLLDVGLNFNLPVSDQMAIVPGFGIGGYYGGSSRPTTIVDENGEVKIIDESTSTVGLDTYGNLNITYRAGERATLLAGLTLHYLIGSERVEDGSESSRVTTLNTSIGAGVAYTF